MTEEAETERQDPPHWVLWKALTGDGDRSQADRASRALLRRLNLREGPGGPEIDVAALLRVKPFRDYMRRLGIDPRRGDLKEWEVQRLACLAVAASAIAAVEENDPALSFGRALAATTGEGAPPALAESRIKGLLRAETPEQLLPHARRAVRLIGRTVDVDRLGQTIAYWCDAKHGPRVRRTLALDYWGAIDAPADAAIA